MKEKRPFIIEIIISIVFIAIGLATNFDYYSTLIFAVGCGIASGAIAQIVRITYWKRPQRQAEYETKKREAYINRVDERKQLLRAKSGQIAYQIMVFILLLLTFILAVLRVEPWVSLMVFLLAILQWGIGIAVFHVLQKRM